MTLVGLDMDDTQGDKAIVGMLERMGVRFSFSKDSITVLGSNSRAGTAFLSGECSLVGADLDLINTPHALPILAVTACFAEGITRLFHVPQARLKETDRIAVMHEELAKMGADIEETPDGLVIRGRGGLTGVKVCGHGDHRVIMALSVAGLAARGVTTIDDVSASAVTFPSFFELLDSVKAGT